MLYWLEFLQRFAQRRRAAGSTSRVWKSVAVATFLLRVYKRRQRPATLAQVLRPGESLLITHTTQRRG